MLVSDGPVEDAAEVEEDEGDPVGETDARLLWNI